MVLVFIALLIAVPLAELYFIFQVAGAIGVLETVVVLVAMSVAGGWLVRRVGMGIVARAVALLAAGKSPTDEMINGAIVLVAGALMLTPGFLTDIVGLLLLLPPVRAALRAVIRRRVRQRIAQGRASKFGTRFGTVINVDSWREPPPSRGELD
jgi:UPF0716 protein FxsA